MTDTLRKPLTAEQVINMRAAWADNGPEYDVVALCDSHESLRAALDAEREKGQALEAEAEGRIQRLASVEAALGHLLCESCQARPLQANGLPVLPMVKPTK